LERCIHCFSWFFDLISGCLGGSIEEERSWRNKRGSRPQKRKGLQIPDLCRNNFWYVVRCLNHYGKPDVDKHGAKPRFHKINLSPGNIAGASLFSDIHFRTDSRNSHGSEKLEFCPWISMLTSIDYFFDFRKRYSTARLFFEIKPSDTKLVVLHTLVDSNCLSLAYNYRGNIFKEECMNR